ncbi:sec-independent translocase [Nocardioides jishulii]|uniref:Twin-arginine translocase subunit TatB n=1 Tax=Nocardioides jishulii TaxID=2575440 RepID=A0A4U2YK27_9ACTN|nr:sec-independent translocase [Nocardioides jishulii]QCX28191.1 twin-arginine translocase subunit TatB [Nocardioides jishulii]TKI60855.1 twin-arginine translocase subunit TatB [Nocardioides jishulii]
MFGMGLTELAVIALVAVMVFGPDRLPELAKQAGQMVKKGRQMANAARDELREELGPEYADLQLRDLDPRALVRKHISDVLAEDDEVAPASAATARLPKGQTPPFDVDAT